LLPLSNILGILTTLSKQDFAQKIVSETFLDYWSARGKRSDWGISMKYSCRDGDMSLYSLLVQCAIVLVVGVG
jgi:hypothetical protein